MADDDFEEIDEPDDPDVVDLESLDDDDILDDEVLDDDDLDDEVDDDVDEEAEEEAEEPEAAAGGDDDEEDDDEDDVLDPDDVEAGLDVILKDRLVAIDEDEEDDDEAPEVDERGDTSTKVLPKRANEFVCQSCFLVKHTSQLADAERLYCRDCV
ncbi:MAG TPA: DUF4193 family protein [Acidimicrobiales bacterium]|jgi:hypothetical protein|nr:DUF4193 family protein [Acidimicrobiales bacterium]